MPAKLKQDSQISPRGKFSLRWLGIIFAIPFSAGLALTDWASYIHRKNWPLAEATVLEIHPACQMLVRGM